MKKVRIDQEGFPEYYIVDPDRIFSGRQEKTVFVTGKRLARWRKAIREFNRVQKEMSEKPAI